MLRRRLAIVLALVTGGFALVPAADAARAEGAPQAQATSEQPPQLRREGRWLVDHRGRVVIVHGFNLVYKHAPYTPPDTAAGFTEADARWLARHGFNAARVGTLWAGLTPEAPGVLDPTYVDGVQRVLDLLAGRHIWLQLDMHQDQWHETYGGEGVPEWAMIRPAPYNEQPPVLAPFPRGYWTPEVSKVFDNFWADEDDLLTGWAGAWRAAAKEWRDQPYLMGYDLLNEPWMGSEWGTCMSSGCPASYAEELQPAMEKGLAAVRDVDRENIVWWEPEQFAGGLPIDTFFEPVARERQLGFSWHSYCPAVFLESQGGGTPVDIETCWDFDRARQEHALDQSRTMHAVPMMSEWGATDNLRAIEIDAAVADEHLMGWAHWAYKGWDDPTSADSDSQGMFEDDADPTTLRTGKARLLVRTYAQATAGTPLEMSFDPETGEFDYLYRPDRSVRAPTRIFVSPLHYPDGYVVEVEHGTARSKSDRMLFVRATGKQPVTVTITPTPVG